MKKDKTKLKRYITRVVASISLGVVLSILSLFVYTDCFYAHRQGTAGAENKLYESFYNQEKTAITDLVCPMTKGEYTRGLPFPFLEDNTYKSESNCSDSKAISCTAPAPSVGINFLGLALDLALWSSISLVIFTIICRLNSKAKK